MLSNFLYFCSRNNRIFGWQPRYSVVNCSQIFCTFAVETTYWRKNNGNECCELLSNFLYFCSRNNVEVTSPIFIVLWIALKFFVLLQSKQQGRAKTLHGSCCELLSNFLYFCSRNNLSIFNKCKPSVVNCSQIFCTFAVETTKYFFKIFYICCELLSNFLYFCSRNNELLLGVILSAVVNCSQIFCTFAVETTHLHQTLQHLQLWIALKFFVLLQSKQHNIPYIHLSYRCELLSNFLYFCSRNNKVLPSSWICLLWIALKFFVLLQSKQHHFFCLNVFYGCELLSNFLYFCSRNNLKF